MGSASSDRTSNISLKHKGVGNMECSKAVEMKNITKKFSGVKALDDVTFTVEKGDIHGLVGENGAGKSTLMNILCGSYSCNTMEGNVYTEKEEIRLTCPKDGNQHGIVMVHQELALIPELSVAENMFLGNMPKKNGMIDWDTIYLKANETLQRLALDIDVHMKVKQLSVGHQQLVEIAKAMLLGGKVMILDEPTAPLTDREIEFLFKVLRQLKKEGITIVYISHRLEEIFSLTDKVSIMRDGKMVITKKTSEVSHHDLVSYMIGREMEDFYPKDKTEARENLLSIENYSVSHPIYSNKNIVDNVSMNFRAGEIVGISGLLGAGRTELMSAIIGAYSKKGNGVVKLRDKVTIIKNPLHAIKQGIGFVSEDRKGNGLIMDQSICFNISLASLKRISKKRLINREKEESLASEMIQKLRIKTSNYNNPVKSLSGGNQQKVVLSKWMATNPQILILDEPTRGVDVGAKYEIYSIMKELAKQNVAIVMISSDLQEVIGMSDRVYVMYEGKVTGELAKDELTEKKIMYHATGAVS